MNGFWREMFEGKDGQIDEKRVVGVPTFCLGILTALAVGIVLIITFFGGHPAIGIVAPGLEVAGFLTGAGAAALAGAVAGDQGKSKSATQNTGG